MLTSPGADAARDYVAPMTDKDRDRIEEPRDPEWDFHEFVSLLGHHPELLRILGIAVELEVNLPGELRSAFASTPTTTTAPIAGPSTS